MGGSSDSDSGSESGRSNRSFKKDKKDKKDKKEKKDKKHDSGDEHDKDKDKDKKDKKDDKHKDDKHKDDKHKDDKHKDDKHKDDKHKDDKHKDDKHKDEHKDKPSSQLPAQISHALSGTGLGGLAQEFLQGGGGHGLLREGGAPASTGPPKIPSNAPTGPGTGASGQRVPCTTTDPFPAQAAGPAPPFIDSTGQPAYVGSAIISGSNVQPCRITASGACFIAADGAEVQHSGRYDLLPLTDAMEWVQSSGGAPPAGRRVVEGGIENGSSLYHACARVNSVLLPGKAGPALGGAQIPAGGTASSVAQDYFVLCWRE